MTEADKQLGIEICKRWPVDLADVQQIIDYVRLKTNLPSTPVEDTTDPARALYLAMVSAAGKL